MIRMIGFLSVKVVVLGSGVSIAQEIWFVIKLVVKNA